MNTMEQHWQSTGFAGIDKLTTGLFDGDLIVIAGRPGMGKTSIALDIAKHLASNSDKTTAFFSLELSIEQLRVRLQRKGGNVPESDSNLLFNDDPMMTVKKMRSICEQIDNLGAVIIDYIQLIDKAEDAERLETREQEVNRISYGLRIMAKRLNVPVICLSQLSRKCLYRADKRPILRDFSSSACLTVDADQIMLLYRDRYYNPDTPMGDTAECIIAKNRHGTPGTVKLQWNPDRGCFSDVE